MESVKEICPPTLIIEDSLEDIEIIRYIIKNLDLKRSFQHCNTVDEAKDYLKGLSVNLLPKLIIIDLNLPGSSGKEFLAYAKKDAVFSPIPIVVFSTSNNPKDIEWCYLNGANSYVIKPVDLDRLTNIVRTTFEFWLDISSPYYDE